MKLENAEEYDDIIGTFDPIFDVYADSTCHDADWLQYTDSGAYIEWDNDFELPVGIVVSIADKNGEIVGDEFLFVMDEDTDDKAEIKDQYAHLIWDMTRPKPKYIDLKLTHGHKTVTTRYVEQDMSMLDKLSDKCADFGDGPWVAGTKLLMDTLRRAARRLFEEAITQEDEAEYENEEEYEDEEDAAEEYEEEV